MKSIFSGVAVALVTPFIGDKVDFQSMGKLIENCMRGGVNNFVLLATTGEGVGVDESERKQLISFCKKQIGTLGKLIVGTGNNNFEVCKQNTIQAKELGADGALIVTPYYNKTSQSGIVEYYKTLSKIGLPIIAYNVPSRTGLNIELETIEELVEGEYIAGIKESTFDIKRIIKIHQICKNRIGVYSGEDSLNYVFYCHGGDGAISVCANVAPKINQDVFLFCRRGDFQQALQKQNELSTLNDLLFCDVNPVPVKFFLEKIKLIRDGRVRLPLISLSNENKIKIEKFIKKSIKNGIFS